MRLDIALAPSEPTYLQMAALHRPNREKYLAWAIRRVVICAVSKQFS